MMVDEHIAVEFVVAVGLIVIPYKSAESTVGEMMVVGCIAVESVVGVGLIVIPYKSVESAVAGLIEAAYMVADWAGSVVP